MIKLFGIAGTCSLAPHILLGYTAASYKLVLLDRATGEQKASDYLAINPRGKVPALQVGDQVITENVAIQYYLVTQFPWIGLGSRDPIGQAKWLSFITWCSNTVHPSFRQTRRPELFAADAAAHPAIVEMGKRDFMRALAEIDNLIGDNRWVFGQQFTTADAYVHVFHLWARMSGFPVDDLASLRRHGAEMMKLSATRTAFAREGIDAGLMDLAEA